MELVEDENAIRDLSGEPYLVVLQRMLAVLRPQTYFEIGSRTGESLKLASCNSIAIDPQFSLTPDFIGSKPSCHLFQMTSDAFFSVYKPTVLLGRQIDFAFLDGMHLAEFLLRDFINTEKSCKSNSIIALHDCIPTDLGIARRVEHDVAAAQKSSHPEWWTGDVWKVLWILKKYRPRLRIISLDATPTGLVLITNLDAAEDILTRNYSEIVLEFDTLDLSKVGIRAFLDHVQIQSTRNFFHFEDISKVFWL